MRKVMRRSQRETDDTEEVRCGQCRGTGVVQHYGADMTCPACAGSKHLMRQRVNPFGVPERVELVEREEDADA